METTILQELLMTLTQGGFLVELAGDDPRYVPAQDVSTIKVRMILHCLRTAEESDLIKVKSLTEPAVDKLLQEIADAQDQILSDISLRELAMSKA